MRKGGENEGTRLQLVLLRRRQLDHCTTEGTKGSWLFVWLHETFEKKHQSWQCRSKQYAEVDAVTCPLYDFIGHSNDPTFHMRMVLVTSYLVYKNLRYTNSVSILIIPKP